MYIVYYTILHSKTMYGDKSCQQISTCMFYLNNFFYLINSIVLKVSMIIHFECINILNRLNHIIESHIGNF